MKNLEDYYVLGLPIDTEIGKCKFVEIKDYPDLAQDLAVMALSQLKIINLLCKQTKSKEKEIRERLDGISLFETVFRIPDLKMSYMNVFSKVFNEESLSEINSENFDEYRSLILRMNCQKEEKINPNPEIQAAIDRSKRVKSQDSGEELKFSDIVTSIVGYNGLSYKDIHEFTLYQLYMTYYRISQIKNYDTTTLFATVAPSKSKIESWSKHINMYEEEQHTMTQDQFNSTTKNTLTED